MFEGPAWLEVVMWSGLRHTNAHALETKYPPETGKQAAAGEHELEKTAVDIDTAGLGLGTDMAGSFEEPFDLTNSSQE